MTPDTIATESSLPEDDSTTSTTDAGAQPSTSVAPSPVNPGDGSPTPGPTQAPSPNATPPATTTAPPAPPAPTPPPDTQSPTIQGSASESLIYDASWSDYCPDRSAITFTVADNVGVVSVTATRNGPAGPGVPMTNLGGGLWRTTLGPFSGLGSGYDQPVTVTATVYDAAGNSTSAAVNVRVLGECLI